ncbi:hypothetical protein [Azospirillum endophyticum]
MRYAVLQTNPRGTAFRWALTPLHAPHHHKPPKGTRHWLHRSDAIQNKSRPKCLNSP